jgi:prophage regulatory protein
MSSQLVTKHKLLERLPFGNTTLYRLIKEKKFPAPIKLGARTSVWPEHVIVAWEKEVAGNPSQ